MTCQAKGWEAMRTAVTIDADLLEKSRHLRGISEMSILVREGLSVLISGKPHAGSPVREELS